MRGGGDRCCYLLFQTSKLHFPFVSPQSDLIHNAILCNGAKNVKCCFPDFLFIFMCEDTFMCDETAVGQPASSLGSERRFSLQSAAAAAAAAAPVEAVVMVVSCFLSQLAVQRAQESWGIVVGAANLKTNRP